MNDRSDPRAIFLVGILCSRVEDPQPAILDCSESLEISFKKIEEYPFDFTEYYDSEFGEDLKRCWFAGRSLENPARIQQWKIQTVEIEAQYNNDSGERLFNLDPGYVTGPKFVLSSRKNHSHRIYLGNGVYAEVTLRFENGQWHAMPNTYPEFQNQRNLDWLTEIRDEWKQKRMDVT